MMSVESGVWWEDSYNVEADNVWLMKISSGSLPIHYFIILLCIFYSTHAFSSVIHTHFIFCWSTLVFCLFLVITLAVLTKKQVQTWDLHITSKFYLFGEYTPILMCCHEGHFHSLPFLIASGADWPVMRKAVSFPWRQHYSAAAFSAAGTVWWFQKLPSPEGLAPLRPFGKMGRRLLGVLTPRSLKMVSRVIGAESSE